MLRITELALPIDGPEDALRRAILERLRIEAADLLDYTVFKRSYDARRRNSGVCFVYIVDVTLRDEAATLRRFARDRTLVPHPDTNYYPPASAPAWPRRTSDRRRLRALRPVRRAAAGADGLSSHRAGARQGCARAHQGHLGPVAQEHADPRVQRAVRRGRRGHCSRTASCTARSRTRSSTAARSCMSSSRPGRPRRSSTSASPTSAPSADGRGLGDARGDHRAGRRGALREQGRRICCSKTAGGEWCEAGQRRNAAQSLCRAGRGPQRPRHLPMLHAPRRVHRAQALRHRLPHRASRNP
jgi:hypothetical protein